MSTPSPQPGVLSDPQPFAHFLTFVLADGVLDPDAVAEALGQITNARKSIAQKDTGADLTATVGFGADAWPRLFPDRAMPAELHPFVELSDADRRFPSTAGDIFVMVKSTRLDLNYQVAKHLARVLGPIASLVDDVQGFGYLDDRDLIDFVDGTENPVGTERASWVLVGDGDDAGGSYLTVQKYTHRTASWDALSTSEQEGFIGRTKFDDLEIDDAEKGPCAHNVKSKVEVDGVENKMYRQNRAFGNVLEHGTMFVGFAKSPTIIEASLRQMIVASDDGTYDGLLDFVDAVTGVNVYVPPQALLDAYA